MNLNGKMERRIHKYSLKYDLGPYALKYCQRQILLPSFLLNSIEITPYTIHKAYVAYDTRYTQLEWLLVYKIELPHIGRNYQLVA